MPRKKKFNITPADLKAMGPKKSIIILIILALLWLFNGDISEVFNNSSPSNNTEIESESESDIISGTVKRVIDGDTLVVSINNQDRRVRMLGVDTPETVHPKKGVQPYGKEASNFTKQSLTGRRVWLEYDSSPLDRYERHLAYIWLEKPAKINESSIRREMFNARLLLEGYAKVMIIKPNKRYEDLFKKFQSEAQSSKRGLWALN